MASSNLLTNREVAKLVAIVDVGEAPVDRQTKSAAHFLLTPDFSSIRQITIIAFALTLVAAAWMLVQFGASVAHEFGDTDDAMRLVFVRDLLHGRGWFDQLVTRIDPPDGVYFHWSRLLDGALASAIWLARQFFSPDRAELLVRTVWPMLWVLPAIVAALVIARNLGTRSAVAIGAILITAELELYRQFHPGRIDHHNIQITFALMALAIATIRELKPRTAAIAGVAAGLGLAIGLEALPFQAVVGASFAVRLAFDRNQARNAGAYGIALVISGVGFYGLQTPPWRWDMSFCDALAFNLVAAIVVAGLGLALVAAASVRLSNAGRWSALGAVGAAATAAYLSIDPICIHGPFAGLDPRLSPDFFSRVEELQPLSSVLAANPLVAIHALTTMAMALAAAIFLWIRNRRAFPEILALVALTAACIAASQYERMEDYSYWFGIPILAAGFSFVVQRWFNDRLVPTLVVAIFFSPIFVSGMLAKVYDHQPPAKRNLGDVLSRCGDTASFSTLAHLPPGVVLSDVYYGPEILALSPHDIINAPYHRMSKTLIASYDALNANSSTAETAVRRLGANYIVDCPLMPGTGKKGLLADLKNAKTPHWLSVLSQPSDTIQIWRVNPGRG